MLQLRQQPATRIEQVLVHLLHPVAGSGRNGRLLPRRQRTVLPIVVRRHGSEGGDLVADGAAKMLQMVLIYPGGGKLRRQRLVGAQKVD